jgi:hypothetical protein
LLPAVPIAAAWKALHRSTMSRSGAATFLILATLSYCWILLGLVFRQAIGPDYSMQRSAITLANLGAMIVLAVWAAMRGRDFRWCLLVVSLATASVWFYVLVISSVV